MLTLLSGFWYFIALFISESLHPNVALVHSKIVAWHPLWGAADSQYGPGQNHLWECPQKVQEVCFYQTVYLKWNLHSLDGQLPFLTFPTIPVMPVSWHFEACDPSACGAGYTTDCNIEVMSLQSLVYRSGHVKLPIICGLNECCR